MTFPKVDEYREIMQASIKFDLIKIADLKAFVAIIDQMDDPKIRQWFVRQVALNCSQLIWKVPTSPFPVDEIEFDHIVHLIDVA